MTCRPSAFLSVALVAMFVAAPLSAQAQGARRPASNRAAKPAAKPRVVAPRPARRPRPAPLPPIQMSQPVVSGPRIEFGADKGSGTFAGSLRGRLEGNAYLRTIGSSALDARADVVEMERGDAGIKQIRAIGNVFFHVEMPAKAGSRAKPVTIEARAARATLDPKALVVTLEGNVDGFYQEQGGGKNLLSGDRVTIQQVGDQYVPTVQGNTRIVLPAETLNPNGNNSQSFGVVTITAERIEGDQRSGVVTFSGNARARSEGGASGFDIAAPSFTLTRNAAGTINTLKTSGKTLIKVDLPPEPPRAAAANASAQTGKPTRVEAIANSVTVFRGADNANTVTLEGDVNGFYRLQPAGAPAADYRFSGDRAVIKYVQPVAGATGTSATSPIPEGLQVEVSGTRGKPSAIEAPAFGLGF